MPKKYAVALAPEQRAELDRLTRTGPAPARTIIRARILLRADADAGDTDAAIAAAVGTSARLVGLARRQFCAGGASAALDRRPQPARPANRVLDGAAEARPVMLACPPAPDGHKTRTLDLLADRVVQLNCVGDGRTVSRDTVGRAPKKTRSGRGA